MICDICKSAANDPRKYGRFMRTGQITAHYFCVLLSANLPQRGRDSQGILGFLGKDILKMINTNSTTKCLYCRRGGATLKCYKCPKLFHLPCMLKNGGCSLFEPRFSALCNKHYKKPCYRRTQTYNWTCIICLEVIERADFHRKGKKILIPPCCKKNMIHDYCAIELAENSAFFTKCPMCQDTHEFQDYLRVHGVFIEHRESTWNNENINPFPEPNEFEKCSAPECNCPEGRNHIVIGHDNYDLTACIYCGAEAAHLMCVQENQEFVCQTCHGVEERLQLREPSPQPGPSNAQQAAPAEEAEILLEIGNRVRQPRVRIQRTVLSAPRSRYGREYRHVADPNLIYRSAFASHQRHGRVRVRRGGVSHGKRRTRR